MSGKDMHRGGLSLKTLAIASAASALATYLVPMIWRPGTMAAAAAMPVIVALISEALARPADRVREAGRLVKEVPRPALRRRERQEAGRRRLRLAVITGLIAFALVAVVLTTTELFAGSAVSSDQRTTLLGGDTSRAEEAPAPAVTPDPAEEEAAPAVPETEATPTPAPEATPQVAPETETAPEPTPAPGAPTPVPTPVPPGPPPATP